NLQLEIVESATVAGRAECSLVQAGGDPAQEILYPFDGSTVSIRLLWDLDVDRVNPACTTVQSVYLRSVHAGRLKPINPCGYFGKVIGKGGKVLLGCIRGHHRGKLLKVLFEP